MIALSWPLSCPGTHVPTVTGVPRGEAPSKVRRRRSPMRSVARVARRRLSTAAAPPLRAMLEGFSAPTVSNAAAALDGLLPPSWMQGATTYGGCSSALCLVGARALEANMPLRSAMVSFVGPAGGHVSVDASVVRSGRSSTVVRSDLIGAKGVATAASFTFAQSRPSAMEEKRFLPPPPSNLRPPDACPTYPDVIGLVRALSPPTEHASAAGVHGPCGRSAGRLPL